MAKRSSIFDDPMKEIQELTALIKEDITALNIAVSDLQTLQNMEMADGNYSEDRVVHSTAVFDDLKKKLMGATKQFQDVLTTRTEVNTLSFSLSLSTLACSLPLYVVIIIINDIVVNVIY